MPFSYLDLRIERTFIEGTLVAHIFDVAHDLNIEPPEKLLQPSVAAERAGAIIELLSPRVMLGADGKPLRGEWSNVEVVPERQSLRLHVRYPLAAPVGTLTVATIMFPYDPQHQTFLNVYERDALTQAILDRGRIQFDYFAGTRQGAIAVVGTFLPIGIRHMLIGPEHLIFLVGLMLLGGTIRQLVIIVTAFTIAHTVSLSLAALNLVTPPVRIIEPAIALSIVYVGADNLLVHDGRDVRAWIATAFGFIHGFAFATVLREFDLPRRALGWSLFSINLGVEIGQLIVVAAVASLLSALRARSEVVGRRLAFAGSIVVMAAGTFWFIQRVFFPQGVS